MNRTGALLAPATTLKLSSPFIFAAGAERGWSCGWCVCVCMFRGGEGPNSTPFAARPDPIRF